MRTQTLRARWLSWFNQTTASDSRSIKLGYRAIYIHPTRHGLLFGLMLLLMLIGSINYNNSLGFVLTFLLGSVATVSILHTYRNLARLAATAGKAEAVFCGQQARFLIFLENPTELNRYALALFYGENQPIFVDIPINATISIPIEKQTVQRGVLSIPVITLFTRYPLGLFSAKCQIELNISCLVYPAPDKGDIPLPPPALAHSNHSGAQDGHEDFSGLRTYHPGDSPRHIAWKAVAREQGILTKQFENELGYEIWLDWNGLSGMDTEARLSRLCRWVLDASNTGNPYGLKLPGITFAPAVGGEHKRKCLEALAMFKLPAPETPIDRARGAA